MGEAKRKHEAMMNGFTKSCGNCQFFQRVALGNPLGNCRARPPVPLMLGMGKGPAGPVPVVNTYWPQLPDNAWCGGWEQKVHVDIGALDVKALETADAEGNA